MKDIYVNKEGVICACTVEVPKPPSILDCHITGFGKPDSKSAFMLQKLAHNQALQACKESAIEFDDQKKIKIILKYQKGDSHFYIQPDTFYQIAADWEIVTVMSEGWQPSYNNPDNSGCEQPSEPIQVARLKVPAPTVATDNLNYMQVVDQSDEEKLKMYMGCKKEELCKMLLQCNKIIESSQYFSVASPVEEEQKRILIEFGEWLKHTDNGTIHYNPTTKETSDSIGFSPSDCFQDDILTVSELVKRFLVTRKS